jgi:hypothetical protein
MIIGQWEILPDGENVVVMRIGENSKTKEKTLTPSAYVRDVRSGLQAVQRRMGVSAFAAEKDANKILILLEKQHAELIALVKEKCKGCLQK